MSGWSIDEMRAAVELRSCFVIGGSFEEVCDFLSLPETSEDGELSQEDVPRPSGTLIDLQTANVLVTIHDRLSEENRAKLLALPVMRAATIAWKLVR